MVLKATLKEESPKESFPKVTSKAAVRRYSSKWVFLEIPQNSQENVCVGVSFNKVERYFPVNIAKFLQTAFLIKTPFLNTSGSCFCQFDKVQVLSFIRNQ